MKPPLILLPFLVAGIGSLLAITPSYPRTVDERAYQAPAPDYRAYIVQYVYDPHMQIVHGQEVYLADVTVLQIRGDRLVEVRKLKGVEYWRGRGGVEERVKASLRLRKKGAKSEESCSGAN